jgi:uncharacterized protein (DUF1697 family)
MKTYIVLFRGINVGGKNLVPMKELVNALEESDYQQVQTYIQSGNVILQSPVNPDNIASIVQDRFGFEPSVMVLEAHEFAAAAGNNPFSSPNGKDVHIYFCQDNPGLNQTKLEKYQASSEKYHLDGKAFYLYAPDGIGKSKLAANLESCLGVAATGRNLNTIEKLLHMLQNP